VFFRDFNFLLELSIGPICNVFTRLEYMVVVIGLGYIFTSTITGYKKGCKQQCSTRSVHGGRVILHKISYEGEEINVI